METSGIILLTSPIIALIVSAILTIYLSRSSIKWPYLIVFGISIVISAGMAYNFLFRSLIYNIETLELFDYIWLIPLIPIFTLALHMFNLITKEHYKEKWKYILNLPFAVLFALVLELVLIYIIAFWTPGDDKGTGIAILSIVSTIFFGIAYFIASIFGFIMDIYRLKK